MSASTRKRPFQIHLSTGVLLMFAAGVLIWANVTDSRFKLMNGKAVKNPGSLSGTEVECSYEEFLDSPGIAEWTGDSEKYFGWPFDAKLVTGPVGARNRDGNVVRIVETITNHSTNTVTVRGQETRWFKNGTFANALIALAILFAVWFVGEWWVQRRTARKSE